MGFIGAFTFVLHSHMPYARLAGRWPHGEEWIHEAAAETYIPLLQTLYDLYEEGVPCKLTIGITPVLAEQLIDADVLRHFDDYLEMKIAAAKSDQAYYGKGSSAADPHLEYLAHWYTQWYDQIRIAFHQRFQRDLIGAFRHLQDEGVIEIITSAATHAYLPLLSRDRSIHAQLRTAVDSYKRLFGRPPQGIWLPECAYRPAYTTEDGHIRAGLESFLAEYDLKVFFTESHSITGGQPAGVAAGDVIGPYGTITRRYVIPASTQAPQRHATTFQAYYVQDSSKNSDLNVSSGVCVIGRNNDTSEQVWSAEWGYPGDFDYREFHKKAGTSGLQYWRVTGAKTDLQLKDAYHPDWADYKVDQHAEHFAHLVGDLLRDYHQKTGKKGLIAANYDTELFGHWWFEGIKWLGLVLRHLSSSGQVDLTTASEFVTQNPPEESLNLPEGSWGAGGTHFTWDNGETHWMWSHIHEAERRMEALVLHYPAPTEDETLALNQAARELMLLQSSDWPFLVTTGQAREYAVQRFSQHADRFDKLASGLENGQPNVNLAQELWELDKIFPIMDYRWFGA